MDIAEFYYTASKDDLDKYYFQYTEWRGEHLVWVGEMITTYPRNKHGRPYSEPAPIYWQPPWQRERQPIKPPRLSFILANKRVPRPGYQLHHDCKLYGTRCLTHIEERDKYDHPDNDDPDYHYPTEMWQEIRDMYRRTGIEPGGHEWKTRTT